VLLDSVVRIANSRCSPTFGALIVPRSPCHSRQVPAKKNGTPLARPNQRVPRRPGGPQILLGLLINASALERLWVAAWSRIAGERFGLSAIGKEPYLRFHRTKGDAPRERNR